MVRSHHLRYLLLLLLGDVAEGGGVPVMWVGASLGCKACLGVYHCSCPMWVSGLLSIIYRCLTLMSVSYGFCGKKKNNTMVCVGW